MRMFFNRSRLRPVCAPVDVGKEDDQVGSDQNEQQLRPGDVDIASMQPSPVHVEPIQAGEQQIGQNESNVTPKHDRSQLRGEHSIGARSVTSSHMLRRFVWIWIHPPMRVGAGSSPAMQMIAEN